MSCGQNCLNYKNRRWPATKSSPAEDLIDIVALLPWYAGVVLAIVGYLVLHRMAVAPLVALKPGDVGGAMFGAVGRGLASAGQYIVPLLCLAGAAISAWRRRTRRSLIERATRSAGPDVLDGMSWREFEMLVGEGSPCRMSACRRNQTLASFFASGRSTFGLDLRHIVEIHGWQRTT